MQIQEPITSGANFRNYEEHKQKELTVKTAPTTYSSEREGHSTPVLATAGSVTVVAGTGALDALVIQSCNVLLHWLLTVVIAERITTKSHVSLQCEEYR